MKKISLSRLETMQIYWQSTVGPLWLTYLARRMIWEYHEYHLSVISRPNSAEKVRDMYALLVNDVSLYKFTCISEEIVKNMISISVIRPTLNT